MTRARTLTLTNNTPGTTTARRGVVRSLRAVVPRAGVVRSPFAFFLFFLEIVLVVGWDV